jgi:hypothetical protein
MARHLEITAATGVAVYFCDAGSSWQHGTNENTNGLLRQYFPKWTVIPRLGGLPGADLTVGTVRLNIGAHPSWMGSSDARAARRLLFGHIG